ncbi:MAG: alternative ribosome rescue aminoacyl-tRNA hydrolase ArfB [Bacteroidales bacterium]|jgi:ribosome-associated protein|nr:alternative ribosome rescue aminoacyl-tRNA hydrolase ArfB [Bacteroidales bacterium]
MEISKLIIGKLLEELSYSSTTSSGKGGQNVNRRSTKVELRYNIQKSKALNDEQKHKIIEKLSNRISKNKELIITCDTERSQLKNKNKVIKKFIRLIKTSLKKQKKRKPTKPTKKSKERRLLIKKIKSDIKKTRKKDF